MSLPGMGPRRNPSDTARVKAMVAELIDTDHLTVLVTELAALSPEPFIVNGADATGLVVTITPVSPDA